MKELLKAYIDGELPAQQIRLVEDALKRDADLRKEFDDLRRISSTLREASVMPSAIGLDKTLSALKSKQAVPKRSPLMRIAPAVGLAFAACLTFVVIDRVNDTSSSDASVAMTSTPYMDNAPRPKHMGTAHEGGHWGMVGKKKAVPRVDETLPATNIAPMQGGADADVAGVPTPRVSGGGGGSDFVAGENGKFTNADDPSGTVFTTESQRGYVSQGVLAKGKKLIVKTAQLSILVPDGKSTSDAATKLAKGLGGYIESSNLTGDDEQGMSGSLTLRIPVDKFDQAMAALQKMGKIEDVSSNGEDVTGAVADDAARLNAMKAQEQSYLGILKQAHHIDDVLAVKDRIDSVQQDIESKTAELKTLSKEAAMSTITLTIDQKAKPKKPVAAGTKKNDWLNTTWATAFGALAAAGKTLLQALIYFVVFCPVWIPIVVLANLVSRRIRQTA